MWWFALVVIIAGEVVRSQAPEKQRRAQRRLMAAQRRVVEASEARLRATAGREFAARADRIEGALARPDLAPDERQALQALRDEWRQRADRVRRGQT